MNIFEVTAFTETVIWFGPVTLPDFFVTLAGAILRTEALMFQPGSGAREHGTLLETIISIITYQIRISAGGEMGFSIASIVAAALTIAIAVWVSRAVQRFVEKRLVGRFSMDAGL